MDKLHSALAFLRTALVYPILAVPAYAYLIIAAFVPANYFVDKSKSTTAKNAAVLLARFVLKLPAIGELVALIPGVGDLLHAAAQEPDAALPPIALPPTLHMRLKSLRKSAPPPAAPPTTPAAVVALLLIPVLMLSACAWGTCVLGQLKAAEQPLIEDVTSDLASADYLGLLAQLGTTVGEAAVTCTVQAVENYEQRKLKVPDGGTAAIVESPVLQHAKAYLAAHKKVVCRESHVS